MARNMLVRWLALTVAALASAPAHGVVTYLSQERRIEVDGVVNGGFDGFSLGAPNFGPFNLTRTHNFRDGRGTGIASQNSSLLPDSILMEGSANLQVTGTGVFAAVSSSLEVSFRLISPSPFQVSHAQMRTGDDRGQRRTSALLSGPMGVVFDWLEDRENASTWPTSPFNGLLPAGNYSLRVEALIIRSEIGGTGSFGAMVSFAMAVPSTNVLGGLTVFAVLTQRRRSRTPA